MQPALALFCLALFTLSVQAQDTREITFPDVPGYQTLACDFHLHTVFSDGSVWPNIRVQEAVRDGLDCIAITDHLEYQPHLDDIPHPDRNRSYVIAADAGEEQDLIILRGAEVTRDMPPGHSNAIFIQDANRLLMDDSVAVFREVQRQGGFVFWNHPNWTAQRADGVARPEEMHLQLIREGLLHGIEVANDLTYSDEALQLALDHDLTIIGTSDIHGLVDWQFGVHEGGHRPVTLVFATNRTASGIKEALLDRRTAVWYQNTLIGREPHLLPLLKASLQIKEATYREDTTVLSVAIENTSDMTFLLVNRSPYTFHTTADVISLKPHQITRIDVKTLDQMTTLALTFEVLNALTAPNTHPLLTMEVTPR